MLRGGFKNTYEKSYIETVRWFPKTMALRSVKWTHVPPYIMVSKFSMDYKWPALQKRTSEDQFWKNWKHQNVRIMENMVIMWYWWRRCVLTTQSFWRLVTTANENLGPWGWPSFWRSEFESSWRLHFDVKFVVEKNQNKQKRGRGLPIWN